MTTKQFQIFKNFTERMKLELERNKEKGDWVPWTNQMEIWEEVDYHFKKLKDSHDMQDSEKIRRQAAALANICLFMYNSCGSMEMILINTKTDLENICNMRYPNEIRNNDTYLESIGWEPDEEEDKWETCKMCDGKGHTENALGLETCYTCNGKGKYIFENLPKYKTQEQKIKEERDRKNWENMGPNDFK
jgi:hypothetical protein